MASSMACSLNMLKNEQNPRISFSNDFGDSKQLENSYREAPVSADFEFSAPSYTMIAADEIFSKGKILPLKENCNTLRDELLSGDDDFEGLPAKGASRWRERLGLKRFNAVGPKKSGGGKSLGSIDELKIQDIIHHHEAAHSYSIFDFKA
ncbi:uncharacterized protein LOC131004751 [Salvia miltiorrhiza]|uniref:uncharacterized protein LOC131004751 n=1 Tax=Salvia miltiorrhiza TaxID=226208 RepID=UPI0025ABF53B|nr:uncharacterized protein LOC131004751 [Salvia miltiorrhiza]